MKAKEIQEALVGTMERWQKIEDASVASTGQVAEKTDNPLVQIVMEIVQRDSEMHHRVQQFIVASLTEQAVSLTPEEAGDVWEMIEKHARLEEQTIELAEQALEAAKGKGMAVQRYLVNYLLQDEQKHDEMLAGLEKVKSSMYPYG